nr:hypothetical protein [Tanacetum cinerariifolium]
MKGLSECKASEGNIRRIRVKDIVKEVEDYLKTYSSARMDISWYGRKEHFILPIQVSTAHVDVSTAKDFTSWKVRFLVFFDGLKPYLMKTLEDGPFVLMSSLSTSKNPLTKRQNQSSNAESHLANQDKRLKSIIISCLPNDVMKSIMKCKTAKEMWNDLILAHEGPSDIRDTKIVALRLKFNAFKSPEGEKVNGTFIRLKCLLNDLENNGVTIPQAEVNAKFVNSLPRKWMSMNQTQRENISIKNDSMATLYGKYNYEEGLIDQIYESETQRFIIQASSSKSLIFNHQFQDSDSDVEKDQRTNNTFVADLNAEYHERALLANQKRFYKRSGRVGSARKLFDKSKETYFACGKLGYFQKDYYNGKYNGLKAEMVVLTKRIDDMTKGKNEKGKKEKEKSEKGLIAESFSWDDESVSSDDEGSTKIRAFMAIAEDELSTCSKVTLDQLLYEQVPKNIVKALGEKGRRNKKISSKEVVFTKADESLFVLAPEITSNSESECDSQEPLLPLPKLIGAAPFGTLESLIALSDLNLNMANLTLDSPVPKKTRPSVKVSPTYVIKKKTEKSPAIPKPCSDKKADSSTKQLLLTLMEECSTCGSTNHLTKEHLEHAAIKKTLIKLKAQSPLKPLPQKAPMIPKHFKECKYCGFNDHHSDHWIKQYLHRYSKESGHKVVFGDDSSGDTKGKMENLNEVRVKELRRDNRIEFRNHILEYFCNGISQNFSSPCTPEQNGGEAANTACYTQNRSIIVKRHEKSYDVFRGRSLDISYFHVFGCPVHIHNHKDHLGKFNEKANDGFFFGYSLVAKAFRVFNIRRQEMEETLHVTFSKGDEAISQSSTKGDAINFNENRSFQMMNSLNQGVKLLSALKILNRWSREKHIELVNIIGEPLAGITTRSKIRDSNATSASECLYVSFLSEIEPKKLIEALEEEGWIIAMQEELNQFERNKVWTLVPKPQDYMGFMVYQMNVKSAFLNGKILEEVYVQQPPGFESSEFPNPVCKLDKALYGLKQALAWYETLLKFLIQHKFVREKYVKDLLKKYDLADCALVKCLMLPPNNLGPDESGVSVNETLLRGMIGSLMYLIARRPDMYLKGTPNLDLWYPKGSGFDLKAYSDSDYTGCNLDRKSTSKGC